MPKSAFPEPPAAIPATSTPMLDAAIARLDAHKAEFAALSLDARIALLVELRERLILSAEEWVALEASAKGAWPGTPDYGEVFTSGPVPSVRNIRLLEWALAEIRDHGAPRIAAKNLSQRADGRLVAQVLPFDLWDGLALTGYTAEIWLQPGITRENYAKHQAEHYRNRDAHGRLSLVLGAGNQSSIPVTDTLQKLFVENEVVLLKMNPVNEYLGPVFEKIFAPLIERGFFALVYGGGDVGAYLCKHPSVADIHITGSDQTHDMIVWGPREGREERKAKGEKSLDKPISSELGNVTPIIVVPAKWTDKELAFHAENIAAMVANNASFNCIAGKLVVTHAGWAQRGQFLAAVRKAIGEIPARKAYYPGARQRWETIVNSHPQAEVLGTDGEAQVPWTFIPGVDPENTNDSAFRIEPFCGVLHEVALEAASVPDFLAKAVAFVNDKVWGTLAVSVLIHPSTRKDPQGEAAFQTALDNLKYGTIAINCWPGLSFGLMTTSWGAYPGHSLEDIQSGNGSVHNTFLFDSPQKSVLYSPFIPMTKPLYFHTHRTLHRMAPPLMKYMSAPGPFKLLRILPYAMG